MMNAAVLRALVGHVIEPLINVDVLDTVLADIFEEGVIGGRGRLSPDTLLARQDWPSLGEPFFEIIKLIATMRFQPENLDFDPLAVLGIMRGRQAQNAGDLAYCRVAGDKIGELAQGGLDTLDVALGWQRFLEQPVAMQAAAREHDHRRWIHQHHQLVHDFMAVRVALDVLEIDVGVETDRLDDVGLAALGAGDGADAKEQADNSAQVENERLARQAEKEEREKLKKVVFLKDGGKVKMVQVATGIADDANIEIKSGVKSGDEVISGSYSAISRKLKDGAKVVMEKAEKK